MLVNTKLGITIIATYGTLWYNFVYEKRNNLCGNVPAGEKAVEEYKQRRENKIRADSGGGKMEEKE